MESDKLSTLIEKRKNWVEISKKNNFDFDNILSGMYSDPTHFIFEIFQNAEDAGATEISFDLSDNELIIRHNGRDFDINDVDGITGIGKSTKKDDINQIGKFGVGFKSVFAITKAPIIHSGNYHFEIKDFVIPSLIDNRESKDTQINLPFNHPKRTENDIHEIVRDKLGNISPRTFLFLKNINGIEWQTPELYGQYYKEINNISKNVDRISIISEKGEEENFEEYLVLKRKVEIDNENLFVEIAYRIISNEKGIEIIEKSEDTKLIVFFPTEKDTYLDFLIQAPFKTTPNRENIPLDDEQNQLLIEELANLVAESIPIVKDLGYLNIPFLEALPIEKQTYNNKGIIYSTIYDKVKEKLLSDEKLLPTSKNDFTTAQKALLARGKDLVELFDENDIRDLYNKQNWLDTYITDDKAHKLKWYLENDLNIKEIDFVDFSKTITKEFLESKSDDWLIKFYIKLLDNRSLWTKNYRIEGKLRYKPIIRLSDDSMIEPYDNDGKIQVYLPSETESKYPTVKENFVKNKEVKNFFKELGLSKPDIFAEINEFIITKYKSSVQDIDIKEYFEDFEKLLYAFQKEENTKMKELIDDLKNLYIIYSLNSITGEKNFCKPNETYIKTPSLLEYFKDFDHVFFVSDELYKNSLCLKSKIKLTQLLLAIGCKDKPRRVKFDPQLSDYEKDRLRQSNYNSGLTREIETYDFDFEGLNNFIENITIDKSLLLWNFLLKSLKTFNHWNKKDFFNGGYKWFYYRENTETFQSKFLKKLKNEPWLVDINNNLVSPSNICFSELNDSYHKENENVEVLKNILNFKPDEIKKIEERTGGKFIPREELEEYENYKREKKEKELINEKQQKPWHPSVEPENIESNVEEIYPEKLYTPDLRGQRAYDYDSEADNRELNTDIEENLKDDENLSKNHLKDIGNWGEKFVYNHLRKKFKHQDEFEIIWLNENADTGRGYDFLILSGEEEIEYIEVKTKTDDLKKLIEITGTQWEFARKLFNENDGDKYKVYVVSNAGSENVKIEVLSNPVKLWKEGKLYAHPVNLKL